MEESEYNKKYLSEQGPKWTFSYDLKKNSGFILEHETNVSYEFKFHYNKFTLLKEEAKERFENLGDIEKKWIENCSSEAYSMQKM